MSSKQHLLHWQKTRHHTHTRTHIYYFWRLIYCLFRATTFSLFFLPDLYLACLYLPIWGRWDGMRGRSFSDWQQLPLFTNLNCKCRNPHRLTNYIVTNMPLLNRHKSCAPLDTDATTYHRGACPFSTPGHIRRDSPVTLVTVSLETPRSITFMLWSPPYEEVSFYH